MYRSRTSCRDPPRGPLAEDLDVALRYRRSRSLYPQLPFPPLSLSLAHFPSRDVSRRSKVGPYGILRELSVSCRALFRWLAVDRGCRKTTRSHDMAGRFLRAQ